MDVEIDVSGYRPELAISKNKQVAITCEIIKFESGHPKQSGKAIRLGMTKADAMRLLALLKSAQQQFGWPDEPGPVTGFEVLPAGKKH
jgi:hypothetical protein